MDINKLIENIGADKLREINDFLNSAEGEKLRKKAEKADKNKLLSELSKLDIETVKKQLKGTPIADILKKNGHQDRGR